MGNSNKDGGRVFAFGCCFLEFLHQGLVSCWVTVSSVNHDKGDLSASCVSRRKDDGFVRHCCGGHDDERCTVFEHVVNFNNNYSIKDKAV
jgi:hypothetical protein